MPKSSDDRFDFVADVVLRQNLNQIFRDILDLISMMDHYNPSIQINLRRTIIIYTAAIIEALVHYIVQRRLALLEFEEESWSYLGNPHIEHEYEDGQGRRIQIISAKRFKKKIKITKGTQFKTITQIAFQNGLINQSLFKDIDKVRQLRNRIHLASLEDIEKKYSKKILDDVFDVARRVTEVAEGL